jgi:enolase-phosphatase E1
MSHAIARPQVYLLDVEGTIAPISLVSEQLFPYARKHFEQFLWQNEKEIEAQEARGEDIAAENEIWANLLSLGLENRKEVDPEAPRIWSEPAREALSTDLPRMISMTPNAAIPKFLEYIYWLMDRDRKSTALKALQGRIWRTGFESGELKGTLFADVPPALERWTEHGRVAIYSSGSVESQKLLFRYSTFGDLSLLISDYFDTKIGAKTSAASYAAIAAALHVAPNEVCFFSDVVRELDPAREAGMDTRLVVRSGNAPIEDAHGHCVVESFDAIH